MRRLLGASISQLGLKIIAAICMFCYVFSKSVLQRGVLDLDAYNTNSLLSAMSGGSSVMGIATIAVLMELMAGMGLTIYAFLLVEGFCHTKQFFYYFLNVCCFALLSEPIYDYAMVGKQFDFTSQNPMFGVAIALIVLYGIKLLQKNEKKHWFLSGMITLAGCLWCYFLNVEFGLFCVLISAVFYLFYDKHGLKITLAIILGIPYVTSVFAAYPLFIYSGKRGKEYKKHIFYLGYPLILALACVCLNFMGNDSMRSLEERAGNSTIFVEKIDGLQEDFIRGMDVSSVLVEEASGVRYKNDLGEEEDVFAILEEAGVNYARIRVWNDPYDKHGNGYGGGNNDVTSAITLGKRATAHHMAVNVDFHYSDFWADPSKQMAPKEWAHLTIQDKTQAIYDFTYQSLDQMLAEKIDVQMVQIGNEINHGIAGETDFERMLMLLESASKAVRAIEEKYQKEMKIAVHYTEIDNPANIMKIAGNLEKAGLDYDIFGVSYYTYWHGSFENLKQVLMDLKTTYQKETCIMETSYLFTDTDADLSANSIDASSALEEYPVSPQGQANFVRDVMAIAHEAESLGVFYWEGCWIAASSNYNENKALYEETGAGWASSYAASYDKNDAGKYYGGCSWDNQAMFDANGIALPSLQVFSFVDCGAKGEKLEVVAVKELALEVQRGTSLSMPDKVEVIYNDSSVKEALPVTWDASQLLAIDMEKAGEYEITGEISGGIKTVAHVKVCSLNFVKNHSFEEADTSMWKVVSRTGEDPTDVQKKAADAYTGEKSYHFWSANTQDFDLEQEIEELKEGNYRASVFLQGADVGSSASIYLYAKVIRADGLVELLQSEPVHLDGWINWKNPQIEGISISKGDKVTIGVHISCKEKGWGTIDDFEFSME